MSDLSSELLDLTDLLFWFITIIVFLAVAGSCFMKQVQIAK